MLVRRDCGVKLAVVRTPYMDLGVPPKPHRFEYLNPKFNTF